MIKIVQIVTLIIVLRQIQALNTQMMMKMNKKCIMNQEDRKEFMVKMKNLKSIGQDSLAKNSLTYVTSSVN